jgi:hypothetical protein
VWKSVCQLCGCSEASEPQFFSVKLAHPLVKWLGFHYRTDMHKEARLVFICANEAPIIRKPVFHVEQGKDRRSSVS